MSPARAGGGASALSATGPADALRRGDGLVHRRAALGREHRQPVRGEQRRRALVVEPPRAALVERGGGDRLRRPRRRRRRSAGAGRAGAKASRGGRRRARARGRPPRGSGSSARSSCSRSASRPSGPTTHATTGFPAPAVARLSAGQPVGLLEARAPGMDDDHRVDAVVVEQPAGRGEVVLQRRAHAEVDGVLDAVGAREALGQRRDRRGGSARRARAGGWCTRRSRSARDRPSSSRCRRGARAAAAGARAAPRVEQRLGALDAQHARLAQEGVDRGLVAERAPRYATAPRRAGGRGCP